MDHSKRTLTDLDRARIARGWRGSNLSQPAYAAEHSITDRTLRAYIARWAPVRPDGSQAVRKIVLDAIDRLQAVLGALEEPTSPGHDEQPTGVPDGGTFVPAAATSLLRGCLPAQAPRPKEAPSPLAQGDVREPDLHCASKKWSSANDAPA